MIKKRLKKLCRAELNNYDNGHSSCSLVIIFYYKCHKNYSHRPPLYTTGDLKLNNESEITLGKKSHKISFSGTKINQSDGAALFIFNDPPTALIKKCYRLVTLLQKGLVKQYLFCVRSVRGFSLCLCNLMSH